MNVMFPATNSDKMAAITEQLIATDEASSRIAPRVLGTVNAHDSQQDSEVIEVLSDCEETDTNDYAYMDTYNINRTKDVGEKLTKDCSQTLFLKSALIPFSCLQAGTQSR